MKNFISVDNLVKKFDDFTLCPVSFEMDKGYILGVIGRNGCGKTTLLRMIMGNMTYHTVIFFLYGVIIFCIPTMILLIKRKLFEYHLVHRERIFGKITTEIMRTLKMAVEAIITFVVYFISILMLWAVICHWAGVDDFENELVYREFGEGRVMLVMCFAIIFFIQSLLFYIGKRSKRIRIGFFVLMVMMCIINGYIEMHCYTDVNLSKGEIVVHDFDETNMYSFDDIRTYYVYSEADTDNKVVSVELKDDRVIEMFSNKSGYSDTYS